MAPCHECWWVGRRSTILLLGISERVAVCGEHLHEDGELNIPSAIWTQSLSLSQ